MSTRKRCKIVGGPSEMALMFAFFGRSQMDCQQREVVLQIESGLDFGENIEVTRLNISIEILAYGECPGGSEWRFGGSAFPSDFKYHDRDRAPHRAVRGRYDSHSRSGWIEITRWQLSGWNL